jgi:hypothetical protein
MQFLQGLLCNEQNENHLPQTVNEGKGQVTADREVLSQHLTGGTNKNPEGKLLQ